MQVKYSCTLVCFEHKPRNKQKCSVFIRLTRAPKTILDSFNNRHVTKRRDTKLREALLHIGTPLRYKKFERCRRHYWNYTEKRGCSCEAGSDRLSPTFLSNFSCQAFTFTPQLKTTSTNAHRYGTKRLAQKEPCKPEPKDKSQ